MLKKGDIVFYTSSGKPVDEAIAYFSHSKEKIVHCAIWIGEDKTIEANGGKRVGYATVSQYSRSHNILYKTCPSLTDEQRDGIVNYLLSQFGEKYDYFEIMQIFFEDFHVSIPYKEEHRRICSSLVYEAYKSVGVLLGNGDDTTPEVVFESKFLIDTNQSPVEVKLKRVYPVVEPVKKGLTISHNFYKNTGNVRNKVANLRSFYGAIQDQGQFGACTAFSSLQFRMALRRQAGLSVIDPSYFANYYMERLSEGTVAQDSGATISEAVTILETYGAMPVAEDPYTPADFSVAPPNHWIADFKLAEDKAQPINPNTILDDTIDALNSGHPVLFGMVVFNELESAVVAQNGILTMPTNPNSSLGGHAVNAIGYDEYNKRILVLNQWGSNWGIKDGVLNGCFWMPYDYYSQYASDAWVGFPG